MKLTISQEEIENTIRAVWEHNNYKIVNDLKFTLNAETGHISTVLEIKPLGKKDKRKYKVCCNKQANHDKILQDLLSQTLNRIKCRSVFCTEDLTVKNEIHPCSVCKETQLERNIMEVLEIKYTNLYWQRDRWD